MFTCDTPNFLQASRKFSTFLRHLAMLSFGCGTEFVNSYMEKFYCFFILYMFKIFLPFFSSWQVVCFGLRDLKQQVFNRYLPLLGRVHGCWPLTEDECDWPDGTGQRHPSEQLRHRPAARPLVWTPGSERSHRNNTFNMDPVEYISVEYCTTTISTTKVRHV